MDFTSFWRAPSRYTPYPATFLLSLDGDQVNAVRDAVASVVARFFGVVGATLSPDGAIGLSALR